MRKIIILFTVLLLSFSLKNVLAKEGMSIEIISFGQIDNSILDYLKDNLKGVFSVEVYQGRSLPMPEYALNKQRNQYLSEDILANLAKFKKEHHQKILAIIDKDLYVPDLNFVFGQADSLNGNCIISLTRLYQSYYGLAEDRDLFLKRALKEAVHEIGHLLNLGHCSNPVCIMHFSNRLSDTDIKDYHFCDKCKSLIRNYF